MNMSVPALTPTRTLYGVRPPKPGLSGSGIWWMPSQSEITKPSNLSCPLSTSVISSWWACILSGLPTPSSIQSTLENDGITLRTSWRRIAQTVRREVDGREVVAGGHRDALVDGVPLLEPRLADVGRGDRRVVFGVAVAGVVLRRWRGRGRRRCGHAACALQAVDDRRHPADQRRILAEALVGAAPPLVAGDADARREVPGDARGPHLLGGGFPDPPHQGGSRVAPRPMLCGNTVAPNTLPCPWTASMP